MSAYPNNLRYTKTHEWVRVDDQNTVTVGITDHAQHLLGDLVFVELPALQKAVKQGQEVAVVESVKTAADVYSPLTGEVVAVNEDLVQTPGLVNSAPYDAGWLFRLKINDTTQLEELLDANGYQNMVEKG